MHFVLTCLYCSISKSDSRRRENGRLFLPVCFAAWRAAAVNGAATRASALQRAEQIDANKQHDAAKACLHTWLYATRRARNERR
jgi:hypothetical protein